jgi:hypothetical protein
MVKPDKTLAKYCSSHPALRRLFLMPTLDILRRVLERLDLKLNPTKTKVVDAGAEHFDFLGFHSSCVKVATVEKFTRILNPPNVQYKDSKIGSKG